MRKSFLILPSFLVLVGMASIACSGSGSGIDRQYSATSVAPTVAEPSPGPDEIAYVAEVKEIFLALYDNSEKVGDLFEQANAAPVYLRNNLWNDRMAQSLAKIQAEHRLLMRMEPPNRFRDTHNALLQATTHYDRAAGFYARWLIETDPALLERASAEMEFGDTALNSAQELMQRFVDAK